MANNPEMMSALTAMERLLSEKQKEVQQIQDTINQMKRTFELMNPGALPKSTEYTGLAIGAATRKLMQETGNHAMTTREIADALLEKGVRTTSKNFSMTVYSVLKQDPTFTRNKAQQWVVVKG